MLIMQTYSCALRLIGTYVLLSTKEQLSSCNCSKQPESGTGIFDTTDVMVLPIKQGVH
jgi:hypothetical protein